MGSILEDWAFRMEEGERVLNKTRNLNVNDNLNDNVNDGDNDNKLLKLKLTITKE